MSTDTEAEILARLERLCGSPEAARAWYHLHPIPALGNRTAATLVKKGNSDSVFAYLDHLDVGGYA